MAGEDRRDRNAFNILFADLVERLLAQADSPGRASDFIAEELRSLIGARTVLVFECSVLAPDHRHRLLSVFPERRRSLAELPGMEAFLEASHAAASGKVLESVPELGAGLSLLLPLAYGNQRVGAVLLLDLLERATLDKALGTLERLASVLALVLRNAVLYTSMEELVSVRTRALEASLREKDVLLREVHHRVKNNLQIVLSFLYLKASGPVGEETRRILQESQSRIYAMALVHEEIYRSEDFSGVDVADYIGRIVDAVMDASSPDAGRECLVERPLRLPLAEAIPCGLIVTELVMNSAKHAFAGGRGGKLTVRVGERDGMAFIEVSDDGPGFPAGLAVQTGDGGIGLSIVECLLDQLGARLELSPPGVPGARAALLFPLPSASMEEWTSSSSKTNA
jgi:two-component sensor histidine kinase